MKRLRRIFELTVPEQRVIVVLLSIFVVAVAYHANRERSGTHAPIQSPSPGILP